MLAYHNNQALKDSRIAQVRAHRLADQLVKGRYWEGGKGCAVGCTVHSGSHSAYESELGIPQVLARLEDRIFEGLPNEAAMLWPERFLAAIKPGTDLSLVWPKFCVWLLVDKESGVIRFAQRQKSKDAIVEVGALYQRLAEGEKVPLADIEKTRSASAAAYAAYAVAADAYAAYAADYAAAAAAYASADAAAYAYAAYAAAYAARNQHYVVMADKLIELLAQVKG